MRRVYPEVPPPLPTPEDDQYLMRGEAPPCTALVHWWDAWRIEGGEYVAQSPERGWYGFMAFSRYQPQTFAAYQFEEMHPPTWEEIEGVPF